MSSVVDTEHVSNSILSCIPREEYELIEPWLEPVKIETGTVIVLSGQPLEYFYFITSGIVSLTASTSDGESIEVAMIGNEGTLGQCMLYGQRAAALNKEVLGKSVEALRIPVSKIQAILYQCHELNANLFTFLFNQMTQISQNLVCCHFHSVEQQVCKWLLLRHDRMLGPLCVTQDRIAQMLGVRRASVNEALQRLQQNDLITCRRGSIEIKATEKIEAYSCDCYYIIKSYALIHYCTGSHASINNMN